MTTSASFFTFHLNKKPSLGLPTSHSFLQSPLWNNTLPQQKKAIYANVSIHLQLSVLMRCGHVSRLVENWLCNPMEQLKKAASKSSIMLVSDKEEDTGILSVVNNHSLVPLGQQSMEIQLPCLFTIVYVTYHCGSVSISINQIESLDFLLSLTKMNSFLVKCDLKPNSVTIHHMCDIAASETYKELPTIEKDPWVIYHPSEPLPYLLQDMYLNKKNELNLMHIKEHILYEEEEEDDESSSEEYSILDNDSLLRLVQDTLQYIQSNGGAFTQELNDLQYKLYEYL